MCWHCVCAWGANRLIGAPLVSGASRSLLTSRITSESRGRTNDWRRLEGQTQINTEEAAVETSCRACVCVRARACVASSSALITRLRFQHMWSPAFSANRKRDDVAADQSAAGIFPLAAPPTLSAPPTSCCEAPAETFPAVSIRQTNLGDTLNVDFESLRWSGRSWLTLDFKQASIGTYIYIFW